MFFPLQFVVERVENALVFTVSGGACGECSCLDSLWWSLWRMFLSLQFVVQPVVNVLVLTVCGGACGECSFLGSFW